MGLYDTTGQSLDSFLSVNARMTSASPELEQNIRFIEYSLELYYGTIKQEPYLHIHIIII